MFYRRTLPHLQRDAKPHFLTFCTFHRWILPESIRDLVLQSCIHYNGIKMELYVAVVMPDHVHAIFTPLVNEHELRVYSLAEITQGMKSSSAHQINRLLGRKGQVWQDESFDRVLRSSEKLDEKVRYVLNNPVRRGLVQEPEQYPWLWVCEHLKQVERSTGTGGGAFDKLRAGSVPT